MEWKFKKLQVSSLPSISQCNIDIIAEILSKKLGLDFNKIYSIITELLVKVFKERKIKLSEISIPKEIVIEIFREASKLDNEVRDFIMRNNIDLENIDEAFKKLVTLL
jgi:hypothetical protein